MTEQEYLTLDYDDPRRIEYNKTLVINYPWLQPKNIELWTEKPYNYKFTWLDDMPDTWRLAFGMEMVKEIDTLLRQYDYTDQYQISQIKEKYGILRWYDFGGPEGLLDIITKYEKKSAEVCIRCGKPAVGHTDGWIEYLCKDCLERETYA